MKIILEQTEINTDMHTHKYTHVYTLHTQKKHANTHTQYTWWYFTYGCRMPAVMLVTIRRLYKEGRVGQAFGKNLPA